MKKLILITLLLALLAAVPASAEAPTGIQIDWSDTALQAFLEAGYDGTWYTLTLRDVQAEILIPSGFELRETTEEEHEKGIALQFENDEMGGEIIIMDTYLEGFEGVADLGPAIQEQYPESTVQYALVNGHSAVMYTVEELEKMNIVFPLGEYRFVQIMFSPVTGNNKLLPFFVASIQF